MFEISERLMEKHRRPTGFDPRRDRWGVLLVNMGGPNTTAEIKGYLKRIFLDKAIISMPLSWLLQRPLAILISSLRARRVAERYDLIGGASPLLRHSQEICGQLQTELRCTFPEVRVYTAMRYSEPLIGTAVDKAVADGCRQLLAVSMFPQYCHATTGSSLLELGEAVKALSTPVGVDVVDEYHNHPGYVDLVRKRIEGIYDSLSDGTRTKLLFSAHSIPEKLRQSGDPYVAQTEESARLAGEGFDYALSYQSQTGPVEWVGPKTVELVEQLASQGYERVVVVPISFVIDNLETLYDIDIVLSEHCRRLGLELLRTACFNGENDFVGFLNQLISDRVGQWEPR